MWWPFKKEKNLEGVLELVCLDAAVPKSRFLSVPASVDQVAMHNFLRAFAGHEGESGRLPPHHIQNKPVPSSFYYWSAGDFEIVLPREEVVDKPVASTRVYFKEDEVQKLFKECLKLRGARDKAEQFAKFKSLMDRGHIPIVESMCFEVPSRKYMKMALQVEGYKLGCRTYGQLRADFSRGQLFSVGVAYSADARFHDGKFFLTELALYAYVGFSTAQTKAGTMCLSVGHIMKVLHDGERYTVSVHTEPNLLQGVVRGQEFERIKDIGKREFVVAPGVNGVKSLQVYRDFMKVVAKRESGPVYDFASKKDFFVKI